MSVQLDINLFKQVLPEDYRLLEVIERQLSNFQFVPERYVLDSSGLRTDKALFRLNRLAEWKLIWRVPKEGLGYVGYTLNNAGLDALAIKDLIDNDQVRALGKPLGIGKEADVLDGLNARGRRIAIKFHRLGRSSFRQTRRTRGYSINQEHSMWITQSKKATKKEFAALQILTEAKVDVPRPFYENRHVIVMTFIDGVELYRTHPRNPALVLKQVILNVRKAYQRTGLIHGDLSQFNIVLRNNGKILIIDWPQHVDTTHPNAQEMLDRDVTNIQNYFKRTYKISFNHKETIDYIIGFRRRPPTYI